MFSKPSFTQIPNLLFDEMLPHLKEGELRVLMVIMRQTFGWGNKEWDRISITQMMAKTGMERRAVIRSVKSLDKKGLITKVVNGTKSNQQTWYSLSVEKSDFPDNSNNFTQYPKDTPPSILRIPTKETLPKEIKESPPQGGAKERRATPSVASPPSPPPPPDGPFKEKFEERIRISQEQYDYLVRKFGGEAIVHEYAERLYRWGLNNEKKFATKKRHDILIEDWIEEDRKKSKENSEGSQKKLNDTQQRNWDLNQELVAELKDDCSQYCNGLFWFYKHYVLKDSNDSSFDISGLVDHKTFCHQLEKHFGLEILNVRFPNGN
jgi:hypothetical protein